VLAGWSKAITVLCRGYSVCAECSSSGSQWNSQVRPHLETSAPLRAPLAGCSSAYPVQARSDCSSVSAGKCSSVPCRLLQVYDWSSVVGRFLLQARQPGTRCQTISGIRLSAKTLLQARQPGTRCQTISGIRLSAKTLLGDRLRRILVLPVSRNRK